MISGIDASHYQSHQPWLTHKKNGIEFAFVKATEGAGIKDPSFKDHVHGARDAGILVGAYHYFHPKISADDQARHFLNVCSSVTLDLPSALDLETMDGIGASSVTSGALLWLMDVHHTQKKTPLIYSGLYFINGLHNPLEFVKYPLWIAQYRNRMPTLPHPYDNWMFWQNSDTGGKLDHDYFNGSIEELKALTKAV